MSQNIEEQSQGDFKQKNQNQREQIEQQNVLQDELNSKQLIEKQVQKCSTLYKMTEILKAPVKSVKDGRFIFDNISNYGFVQKFFGENIEDENMAVQLCRQMGCEEFSKGDIIMKQGDESNDKLYVILDGRVGIVIAKDTNVFKKLKKAQQNNDEDGQIDFLQKIIEQYGTKVNDLSKGDGFGEKALLVKPQDAKRNATIIALEKTTCITILRKDFLQILENFNKETQLKEQLLIQLMPFLKNITSSSTKEALMLYFKNQSASRGKYLTEEGKFGEYIYILQSGKVTVEKKFLNSNNIYYSDYQTVKLTEISEPSFIGEEILFIDSDIQEQAKFNQKIPQKSKSNNNTPKNTNKTNNNTPKNTNKTNLNEKGWNCDRQETIPTENDEYIQECYKYTVRVESLICKFLLISKQFFLTKFPKEILTDIKDKFLKKEQVRQKVFNSMRNHKQSLQNHGYDNIDPTLHRMNEISNKEIFSQMKPQMIENYNKVLFKKQEQAQSNIHTSQLDKYGEQLNQDFRQDIDEKYEEIEKKKVLLQQKYNLVTTKNPKKHDSQQPSDTIPKQINQRSQSNTPQQSPRQRIHSTGNQNNTQSPAKQKIQHKKQSLVQGNYSTHEQNLDNSNASPLDKLKQCRNVDGSLNTVELMEKVKYNKIQIEEVSVSDIMGDNYDLFENIQASRLVTIKSDLPKEKKEMIARLKEEQEKKMVSQIQEKIQKREVQNLDLGYLNQFQKYQHYKLVQLGKKKVDSPKQIQRSQGSIKLGQDIKDKILQMKNKEKEQLEQETQNLITSVSYLTPQNQKCRTMSSNCYQTEVSQFDYFSDYLSNFCSPNTSNRIITSACSIRQKRQGFTPSMSVRSSFSQQQFNTLQEERNTLSNINFHTKQNSPDIPSLNCLVSTSISKLKTSNDASSNNQQNLDSKRSVFSRGVKSRSCLRIQSNTSNPNQLTNQQIQQNVIETHQPPKLCIDTSYFQSNNLIGEFVNDTPTISKDKCYTTFSLNTPKIPLIANLQTNDDSVSIIMQSPPLQTQNYLSKLQLNLVKKDTPQVDSGSTIQPQVVHKRQFSCLNKIGQSSSSQSTTQSSYFNRDKIQLGFQSPTNIFNQQHKLASPQSSKFKFNDFLALKQKQRQQLNLNRDSKIKKSLSPNNSLPQPSNSLYNYAQINNDFVINTFLK